MGYKLPDGTVDDVYDDLMEGQKLMSIVKAERQSSIYNQDIFVVTLPLNRQLLINSVETFVGIIERRKHIDLYKKEVWIQVRSLLIRQE